MVGKWGVISHIPDLTWHIQVYPNVACLCRGKTRKSVSDEAAHGLGQFEAYLTVRQVLSEASTAAEGVLSREPSNFYRCRYAALG